MKAIDIKKELQKDNMYCHISTTLNFDGHFVPRIPETISDSENKDINRICISKTLEGALSAIPNGGSRLTNFLDSEYIFKLFLIDIDDLNIDKSNIYDDEYLFEADLVRDAIHTKEHWITEPFTVPSDKSFIIKLNSWSEESIDLIPYFIETLAETDYDGDIYEAFEDYIGHSNFPCITLIENIDFISEDLDVGECFSIDNDKITESELLEFNKSCAGINYNSGPFEVDFECKKVCNINKLLLGIWRNAIGYYE